LIKGGKEKDGMKNMICNILYLILIVGIPALFSLNGFGIDTWQWWAVLLSIFISNLLGLLKMADLD
jgi:hypothetical protein